MKVVFSFAAIIVLLSSFFIPPFGTSNALMVTSVLFVLALVLLFLKSKKAVK
ncbi:hypothetical protein [Halobacillus sp. A5]|uniref:hypothetical protein n=1 Tax=Halobacillus sp. A5 TaxID=2880263 RepID=UPI0020A6702D|nr:hypothetical protein [Halobacillus sp. A5]MCP3026427.1 hypothetical protein [Halobacillus sp. A5]